MTTKVYKGEKYDYELMIGAVKLHLELKEKLQNAKEELQTVEEAHLEAKLSLEDVELEWHNHLSEWDGFKPFEDKLKEVKDEI